MIMAIYPLIQPFTCGGVNVGLLDIIYNHQHKNIFTSDLASLIFDSQITNMQGIRFLLLQITVSLPFSEKRGPSVS
jgi:hypothetical protein